ncbi:MAG: leucine-rich repeat protein, partial [Bacteroidales bacterium]|nr:leucine-rich repeat protein [Bacteroidales bacterium]
GFNEGFSDSTPLWGLYPYRADATADNSSVTTTLPATQTGRAGSFAKGTFITLARSQSLKMGFYNVCGGVRFSLVNDNIKEVVFEGKNDENLAGKVKLAFDGGYPVVSKVEGEEKAITLTAPGGGCFEKGKWYYIVALPGTLSSGFKMTFNTADEYAVRSSSSSVTIKRGVFGSIEDVDQGLIFIQKGTDPVGDNIVFKDPAAKFACVAKYDTNGDGEVSIAEAEAATSFSGLFTNWKGVTSFDEIKYFKNVHSINELFDGCTKLVSITIPENITDLGTYAFRGCSSLTSVNLPSNITTIGSYSFNNCSKLATIEIPSKVASIGGSAFGGCSLLTTVDLPSNVTSIGDYAFGGCSNLSSIGIPSKVTSIGSSAFSGCSALKQISIPNGVTSLGTFAFSGCSSLTAANIPSGISSVPGYCFEGCISLTSVSIPSNVTSVGTRAFYGVKLWKLELPSSVSSLGSNCFGSDIICVLLPATSPVSIQSDAFGGVIGIFVPANMIEMYKVMTNWSNYSGKIHPISSYREKNAFTLATSGAVDMGTSVKWAACNLGASKPEEYGGYYQWAGTQDVTSTSIYLDWRNCPYHTGSTWETGWTKYIPSDKPSYWSGAGSPDNKTVLDPEDDVAHVTLGGNWRIPTREEFEELENNCVREWTAYQGINGRMVYGIGSSNKIFLPAAGSRSGDFLSNVGSNGYFWSSSLYTDDPCSAYGLYFDSYDVGTVDYGRCRGRSVRPVSE